MDWEKFVPKENDSEVYSGKLPGYNYGAVLPFANNPETGDTRFEPFNAGPIGGIRNLLQSFEDIVSGKTPSYIPDSETGKAKLNPAVNETAKDVALGMVGSPAEKPSGALGSFAGINARTANKAMAAKAEEMLAKGASPEEVWNTTGFFKGEDGKLRFEISDQNAEWSNAAEKHMSPDNIGQKITLPDKLIPLGRLLEHPELYAAYPSARNITLHNYDTWNPGAKALYNPTWQSIALAPDRRDLALSTLLHETQHHIQDTEKFASGGNPGQFLPKDYGKQLSEHFSKVDPFHKKFESLGLNLYDVDDAIIRAVNHDKLRPDQVNLINILPLTTKELFEYMELVKKGTDLFGQQAKAFSQYENLPGEREARAVQDRFENWKTDFPKY
jgi:hypothetical protein